MLSVEKQHFRVDVNEILQLHVVRYKDSRKKQAPVVHILHGMGEHALRYEHFAFFLADNGFTVYAHDHRHHGESLLSEKDLGVFLKHETFDDLSEDVRRVQAFIRGQEETDDVTLFGHSMGTVVLRRYLQQDPLMVKRAVIMGSPSIPAFIEYHGMMFLSKITGLGKHLDEPNRFIARTINRSVVKKLPVYDDPYDWISTDEKVVKHFREGEKTCFTYNKHFYPEFFRCIKKINTKKEMAKTVNVPHLYISGTEDPLSNNMRGIEKIVERQKLVQPYHRATVIPIKDARHEVLNEVDYQVAYDAVLKWIKEH